LINGIGGDDSTLDVRDGSWHHLAFTINGTSVKIYKDGGDAAINGSNPTNNQGTAFGSWTAGQTFDGRSQPFYIGTNGALVSGNAYYFNGLMDEVGIFQSELSGSEVSAIYNSGVPATLTATAWYRMGDGTGDTDSGGGAPTAGDTIGTVADQAGSANATGQNGPTYSNGVPPGYSIRSVNFDGTNDYLSIAASSDFDFGTGNFTMSVWFKADTISGGGADYYALLDFRGSSSDIAPTLYMSQHTGYRLYVYNGSTVVNYNTTPTVGQWYHVAYTRSGTTGTIYLNGSSVASGTDSGDYNLSTPAPKVGKVATSATGKYFDGKVDEVSLFDSALSPTNVTAIYNSGVPADLTSLSPMGWWRMGDGTEDGSGTTIYDMRPSGTPNNGTLFNGPTYSSDTP
tara:strand:+ start:266 stop:1462 length:1197 start_codon:yes stop_codon:yes gene_type:complete